MQSRWDHIKVEVNKFIPDHSAEVRKKASGTNEEDTVRRAMAAYASDYVHEFSLLHCWYLLKDEPKWGDTKHVRDAKEIDEVHVDSNTIDGGLNPSPPSIGGKRPLGRDSTKEADRKKSCSTSSSTNDFPVHFQELTIKKLDRWKEDSILRTAHQERSRAIEKEIVDLYKTVQTKKLELQDREMAEIEKKKGSQNFERRGAYYKHGLVCVK